MTIKNEKEYKVYEARVEQLIQRGTELGDMELLSGEEKDEFTMLSEALDEYGLAYHPFRRICNPTSLNISICNARSSTFGRKLLKSMN